MAEQGYRGADAVEFQARRVNGGPDRRFPYGRQNYAIERDGIIGPIRANTSANVFTAAAHSG